MSYSRLYLWLVAQRRWVLLAVALATVVGVIVSSRLQLDEDILAMLPNRDPVVDGFQYALKKFRQIDRVYLDVTSPAAADALHARLATNPALARITYRIETADQHKLTGFLTGALPVLFTEADAVALVEKLPPAKVREYLTTMRRKLAGPEGMVLKDMVAADPIGQTALVGAKLRPLQTGLGDMHIEDGRVTSADGRHVLLVAEPKFPTGADARSRQLVADLLGAAAAVEQQFPGTHVAVTGGHRMAVENASLLQTDSARCTVVGIVAMAVLCLTAFRRRWLAAVTFLPSLFGMLIATAALAWWQDRLSAMAMGFASVAIGITVDYAIYVVYHLDDAAGMTREGAGRHIGRLVLPITAGALTTVAAFVVLATSPLRGYQQIGVFGVIGVLVSAAFALTILPLFVPIPRANSQPPLWLTRLLDRFFVWRTRWLRWLLVAVVVASIGAAFGLPKVRFEGDFGKLNGITAAARQDEELIRSTWGEALGMTLVVTRGRTLEEALARNDTLAGQLAGEPNVTAIHSLAAVCPSLATQHENYRRWQTFWTAQRRAELRETLQQTGQELGFRAEAFAPFWRRLEAEPDWITPATFQDTPLAPAITERVMVAGDDTAVATMVKLADRKQADRLRDRLPGVLVLDKVAFTEHIAGLAKQGLGTFAVATTVLVAAILYLTLGSLALVAATLLPIAVGLLWTFGAMGWLGLPVDMMNSIFVIFIIGIGEDYSVFFVTSRLDEWRGHPPRLAASSAAVVISALTTIFGFGVLAFAKHPVLLSLGTTVLLGITLSFAATLILTLWFTDWVLCPRPAKTITDRYRYQGKWAEQFVFWKLRTDPMFAKLDEAVPRQGFILDLGCGYGVVAHWLASHGPDRTLLGADFDAGKVRVAQQSARGESRLRFEERDLFTWDFPACDAVLLLDVLHYWQPDKQRQLLVKARQSLRPGGKLILRDAARADTKQHRWVEMWERFATRTGQNKTIEGLHFLTVAELTAALEAAGFTQITVTPTGERDSNVLVVAS
jgi:predicted exporter/SAM-dependent methyltransferase